MGDFTTTTKKNRLPLLSPVQTVASTCIVFGGAELGEGFSPVRVPGNASFDRAVQEGKKGAESQKVGLEHFETHTALKQLV